MVVQVTHVGTLSFVIHKLRSDFEKCSDMCHWELLQESEYCPCLKSLMHMDINQTLRYI